MKRIIIIFLSLVLTLLFPTTALAYAEWVDADRMGQEGVVAFENSQELGLLSLATDSNRRPHIIWTDKDYIYYLYFNGSEWVDADGSGQEGVQVYGINYSNASSKCNLVLDSNNRPHIIFQVGSGIADFNLFYLYWNGSSWVDADGVGQANAQITSTNREYDLSLALISDLVPAIAWHSHAAGYIGVNYLYFNGSFWVDADGVGQESRMAFASGSYSYPSLKIRSNGQPAVAFRDLNGGNYQPAYIYYNGLAWVDADGSGLGGVNIYGSTDMIYPSLELDSSNAPNVAWAEKIGSDYSIYFLKWNGLAWVDADGTGQGEIDITSDETDSRRPKLGLNSSSNPAIAWYGDIEATNKAEYLFFNNSSWVDADGEGTESKEIYPEGDQWYVEMVLDSSDSPHILWKDSDELNIYYLEWLGEAEPDGLPQTGGNKLIFLVNQILGI